MASYEDRSERVIRKYNKAKEEHMKLETEKNILMESMKKKYGVSSVEELKKLKEEKERELDDLKDQIDPLLESLEDSLAD